MNEGRWCTEGDDTNCDAATLTLPKQRQVVHILYTYILSTLTLITMCHFHHLYH
jgi:hypothetical protein